MALHDRAVHRTAPGPAVTPAGAGGAGDAEVVPDSLLPEDEEVIGSLKKGLELQDSRSMLENVVTELPPNVVELQGQDNILVVLVLLLR